MADTKLVSKTFLILLRFGRRLWVRVALMALLAVLASISAILFDALIPQVLRERFTPDAVMPILTILASGMLAVSTFSLNVMVTAHHAAASQATPRAHRILLADTTTQTVLATFIGAFVFALSAIILFKARLHSPGASVMVLIFTVAVVVLVILAMLRWIDHLSDLGSMDATLRQTEAEARGSLMQTRSTPALRANPLTEATVMPEEAVPLPSPETGYLQFIDIKSMSESLQSPGAAVYLHVPTGRFVLEGRAVGYAAGLTEAEQDAVLGCLTFGQYRTFEQDSTYGLLVLSEIASRALSAGINDAGTAIDVIARQERLLWDWGEAAKPKDPVIFERIFVPEIDPGEMIKGAFGSIARDGADKIEVVTRLQHALRSLGHSSDPGLARAAGEMADFARGYAEQALVLEAERARLQRAHGGEEPVASTPSRAG